MTQYGYEGQEDYPWLKRGSGDKVPTPSFRTSIAGEQVYDQTFGWESAYIHQLVVIANGADPHAIFDGTGGTIVHHKNGCKLDNRPSNLQVLTQSEHAKLHGLGSKYGNGRKKKGN